MLIIGRSLPCSLGRSNGVNDPRYLFALLALISVHADANGPYDSYGWNTAQGSLAYDASEEITWSSNPAPLNFYYYGSPYSPPQAPMDQALQWAYRPTLPSTSPPPVYPSVLNRLAFTILPFPRPYLSSGSYPQVAPRPGVNYAEAQVLLPQPLSYLRGISNYYNPYQRYINSRPHTPLVVYLLRPPYNLSPNYKIRNPQSPSTPPKLNPNLPGPSPGRAPANETQRVPELKPGKSDRPAVKETKHPKEKQGDHPRNENEDQRETPGRLSPSDRQYWSDLVKTKGWWPGWYKVINTVLPGRR